MKQDKTYLEFLLKMPVSYAGKIHYLPADKFPFLSLEAIGSYKRLGEDDLFSYHLNGIIGYAFYKADLEGVAEARPAMRVGLREYADLGLMQAHFLRLQQRFARNKCAATWYKLYAEYAGGVVSDNEHLAGGRLLWRSFLKTGKCSVYDPKAKALTPVRLTDGDKIWSAYPDVSKRELVLVYKP